MRPRDLVLAVAALAAVSVLVPSFGRADSRQPQLDTAPAHRAHWYGAPILLADAAAVTAVTVAFSRREDIPALAVGAGLAMIADQALAIDRHPGRF